MTEEQLGQLFEVLPQTEASARSRYGGTGLGPAISRHFDQGSTSTVRLPAAVSEPMS